MLPSLLAREVQHGLKQFLKVGFDPSDSLFAGLVKRFTEEESRWMKGPYVQLGLPFRVGAEGRSFFPNFELEHPGYVHQEAAWQRLCSARDSASTLVATGTGSGKTECFLYPLLDHCQRLRAQGKEGGIKALVIYPMNALATDQARRFAEVIHATPAFEGLRVGLFVGGKTSKGNKGQCLMNASGVITDRDAMRSEPPDILLTNYKMLDYLLIRPKDRELWRKNDPDTLRYVVVDELHTFDGAQGTDLALLLRRLRTRLKTDPQRLICAGTSATLGGSSDTAPLREYARQVFGQAFLEESVVTENRLTESEFLGNLPIEHLLQGRNDFPAVLDPIRYGSQEEAVAAWFEVFFSTEPTPDSVADGAWRKHLGELLKRHLLFVNLIKLASHGIVSVEDLQQQMRGPLPESAREVIGQVLDALLALVAWARDPHGRPLVSLRVQLWMRELRRMVATVSRDPQAIELVSANDIPGHEEKHHLPVIQCTDCHCTGWISQQKATQSQLSHDLDGIYRAWFSKHPEIVRLYGREGIKSPLVESVDQFLCTDCLNVQFDGHVCQSCAGKNVMEVLRVSATRTSTKEDFTSNFHDETCPACGSRSSILLGARNTTLGSVVIEQSWLSPYNDDKKLIAFSDSVQDSAHRAGFFTARTYLNNVRIALSRVVDEVAKPVCAWEDFLEEVKETWLREDSPLAMTREQFVSEFIGSNMLWQSDWAEKLLQQGVLPENSPLVGRVKKRMAWQAYAEFTFGSKRGRNLETVGKAVLVPDAEAIRDAARSLLSYLQEELGLRHLEEKQVFHWMFGWMLHLKQRGAVAHPQLRDFQSTGNIFGFLRGKDRQEWLPPVGRRTYQPRFLSLGGSVGEHDTLHSNTGHTFYRHWLRANFLPNENDLALWRDGDEVLIHERAANLLLEREVLVEARSSKEDRVIGLNPQKLQLHREVARLKTPQGRRRLSVPTSLAEELLGMPCLQSVRERYETAEDSRSWFNQQFSRGDLRRIFSAEHTGLLEREQREALELRFKSQPQQPWYENLLSATPTLEMGVDIGSLSSVMLCSVPPNQASYLQRIGRAGRRDGNAFTTTLADGASTHDLYFFEDTEEMLNGPVTPPGIFLKAPEVLRRQLMAFCLDHWVGSGIPASAFPEKTKEAVDAVEVDDEKRFPYNFMAHMQKHEEELLSAFKQVLGEDLDDRVERRMELFMHGSEERDSLRIALLNLFTELKEERQAHQKRSSLTKTKMDQLERTPKDDHRDEQIAEHKKERSKALELIKEINQRELLETLTDSGLIPNYAFPEAGVELKSVLWRKSTSEDETQGIMSLPAERYERPAQSALSEFAPENVFYANRRKVEIEQINMELSKIEMWRLCPTCHHVSNLDIEPDSHGVCPRCGDAQWSNVSQRRQLLRFKQAIAHSNVTDVQIDDSAEEREPKMYVRQMLTEFDPQQVREAYRLATNDTPFGFEFIETVQFRDINFGESSSGGEPYAVASKSVQRPGFKLCKECGQVQRAPRTKAEREKKQLHAFGCAKNGTEDTENLVECLYLYREFSSEALRILVPFTKSGMDPVSVQSFMAALRVGLKQHYRGKVDHLRLITQEESPADGGPTRHYVMIYDSVPGGTGYLHELLADEAKILKALLKEALRHIQSCTCQKHPEKDGCYRCVYQYRLGRDMALISRSRAEAILQEIVEHLEELEKVNSVSDIEINPHFDSDLEAKFIEGLRRLNRVNGMPSIKLVKELVHGKTGYILEVGRELYKVEPQVDLGGNDGVEAPSRPDFVIYPSRSDSVRKPVAVFCDGWAYHQSITREDANKRNALLASGKYWVWGVTWEDVSAAIRNETTSDLSGVAKALRHAPSGQIMNSLDPFKLEGYWDMNALAQLVSFLEAPAPSSAEKDMRALRLGQGCAELLSQMVNLSNMAELQRLQQLFMNRWAQWSLGDTWNKDTNAFYCGSVDEKGLIVVSAFHQSLAQNPDALVTTPGLVVLDAVLEEDEREFHRLWRQWLHLFNTFQFYPGTYLATRENLQRGDLSYVTTQESSRRVVHDSNAALDRAWQEVLESAMEVIHEGLKAIAREGREPPDEVGFELEVNGKVLAECELAWTACKVVLLLPEQDESMAAWQEHGWKTVSTQSEWVTVLSELLVA